MNLLLVLGVAAVLVPIHVVGSRHLLYRDLAFGLVPAVVLIVFARGGFIGQPTALLLVAIFAVFLTVVILNARGHSTEPAVVAGTLPRHLALTVIGIAVLIGGSEMLVIGGVDLARRSGISEALVGLTVVAFGTSMPEVSVSIGSALTGEGGVALGNALGSNIFNILAILGLTAVITPVPVASRFATLDAPVMLAVAAALTVMLFTLKQIGRGWGLALLAAYAGYVYASALPA